MSNRPIVIVDVTYSAAELVAFVPPPAPRDMIRECVETLGAMAVLQEVLAA